MSRSSGCLPIMSDLTNKGSILSRNWNKMLILDLIYMVLFLCSHFRCVISFDSFVFSVRLIFSARFNKRAWNQVFRQNIQSQSFPEIGEIKMKLKLFSVFAGAISGWVLPPDNYTNPCEDFQVQFSKALLKRYFQFESFKKSVLNWNRFHEHRFLKEKQSGGFSNRWPPGGDVNLEQPIRDQARNRFENQS